MRFIVPIFTLLLPIVASAQVYIWKDASGKTHYTDKPPAESNVQSRRLGPSFSTSADAEAARKTEADKRLDTAKQGKDAQEKAANAQKQNAEDEQRGRDCDRARNNLAGVESGQIRFRMGVNGEREALDGAVRETELANAQRAVDSLCSPRPAPAPTNQAVAPATKK